jgi:hypothetical protein
VSGETLRFPTAAASATKITTSAKTINQPTQMLVAALRTTTS